MKTFNPFWPYSILFGRVSSTLYRLVSVFDDLLVFVVYGGDRPGMNIPGPFQLTMRRILSRRTDSLEETMESDGGRSPQTKDHN